MTTSPFVLRVGRVSVLLLALLSSAVPAATPSDFDVIIRRFCETKRLNVRLSDEMPVSEMVRTQASDGSWKDIDYLQAGRSYWMTTLHLTRATALAEDFRVRRNPASRDAVHRALAWWLRNKPRNPNWWFNAIGVPRLLAGCAILFDDELTPEERREIVKMLVASRPQRRMTGQNAAWLDEVGFLCGVISRDAALVRSSIDGMLSEVKISDGEGITRDWCFHQHGRQPQFGNYGMSFLEGQSRHAMLLDGTSFAYPQEKLKLIQGLAEKGYAWIMWNGMMDVSAMGRQLFPDGQRSKAAIVQRAFGYLEKTGWRIPPPPRGFRFFDRSAYAVHRTGEWMASVRASTSSIIGVETWINEDNVKGMCMADGALLTYVTGREYENVFPLWDDWRMIPGVTGYAGKPVGRKRMMNEADDVCASESGVGGTFSFTFRREGLVARKRWTFTDTDILCEGSGITASDGDYEVMTSVEEANAADDAGVVYERPGEFCVRNGSICYVVYAPREAIRFEVADRKGDFRDFMQAHPSCPVSGKVFSLRISHGVRPTGAAYRYRVIPAHGKTQFQRVQPK